jgi:hypothetical protein
MMNPTFLVEAALNGVLLAGMFALLALGLNLIFGVLDIVWVAYVDLVTVCMYAVHVGDPHDVEDAEDQVEAQREERQHACQQDAVQGRFGQEGGSDHRPTYALRTKSCSLSSSDRPSILSRPASRR